MTVRLFSIAFAFVVLLPSLHGLAQQRQSPIACPATEQAVREVEHQIWAAFRNRDLAALDTLIDDDYIATGDDGTRRRKQETLTAVKRPEGDIHTEASEQPEDFHVMFTNGVAILNFARCWTDYERKMGINWGATVRVTMVFACKNGGWRNVAFQETDMPNKNRRPLAGAGEHFDDYVGHYRFGENGDKGEVSITRLGDKLYDTWADEGATELLPGKYDMFFSREDGSVERFVRDKSGKVTGILYTLGDGEFEAKRLP
jgi:Domain of unknown function (DUF4440)